MKTLGPSDTAASAAARVAPAGAEDTQALDARAHDRKAASARIEFANTLRGVAAMSVIFAHLGNTFWHWPTLVEWLTGITWVSAKPSTYSYIVPSTLGSWGVSLFFVISGFVIPYSLERYSVKGFLVGRLWRIWPTCWVGLSITVASVVIGVHFMGGAVPFTFRDAITHFFPPFAAIADSKQIDSVMWTLEIEMFFYGICALAANHMREGRKTLWLFPVGIFMFWLAVDQTIARFADHPGLVRRLASFDTDPVFLVFMFCGVALNLLHRGKLTLVQAAAAIAVCCAMFASTQYIGHMPFPIDLKYYFAGLALFAVCMAVQDWFRRTRVTRFLSDISYPLYVVHGVAGYVVLHALMRLHLNADIAILVTVAFAIAVSWAIHVLVEAPTHRRGQQIARRLSA